MTSQYFSMVFTWLSLILNFLMEMTHANIFRHLRCFYGEKESIDFCVILCSNFLSELMCSMSSILVFIKCWWNMYKIVYMKALIFIYIFSFFCLILWFMSLYYIWREKIFQYSPNEVHGTLLVFYETDRLYLKTNKQTKQVEGKSMKNSMRNPRLKLNILFHESRTSQTLIC